MSWHDPDLYFFLCVLTGLAALLAIIYEFRWWKRPVRLKNAPPLDGLLRDRSALTRLRNRFRRRNPLDYSPPLGPGAPEHDRHLLPWMLPVRRPNEL